MAAYLRTPGTADGGSINEILWGENALSDGAWERCYWRHFSPVHSLSNSAASADFTLPAHTGPGFYDFRKLQLRAHLRIKNSRDGDIIPGEHIVFPVNNPLNSFLKDFRVQLNNKNVTPHYSNCGYKAQVQGALAFNQDVRTNKLYTSGCSWDTSGHLNDLAADPIEKEYLNKGILGRTSFFANVREAERPPKANWAITKGRGYLQGPILTDLASLPVGIPPGVKVDVHMAFADAKWFLLMTEEALADHVNPTYEVEKLELSIMVRELPSDLYVRYMADLNRKAAVQHYVGSNLTYRALREGAAQCAEQDVFAGTTVPARAFLMVVEAASYNGDFMKNPYNFSRRFGPKDAPLNLLKIEVTINGTPVDDYVSTESEQHPQDCMAYNRFLEYTGQADTNKFSPNIRFDEFAGNGRLKPSPALYI